MKNPLKGSVREKCDKKAFFIATNLTSICCIYKEKIVKDVSYRVYVDRTDRSKISSDQKRFFYRIKPIPPFIFREHSL